VQPIDQRVRVVEQFFGQFPKRHGNFLTCVFARLRLEVEPVGAGLFEHFLIDGISLQIERLIGDQRKHHIAIINARAEVDQWLFWQMGGLGPMAGQAHHFRQYAPKKLPYAVKRYTNEVNRLYGVLNKQLRGKDFVTGRYSIADMAIWGWVVPYKNQGQKLEDFPHLKKWFERMGDRPAVKRGFALGLDLRRGTLGDKTKEAAKARKILFNQRAK